MKKLLIILLTLLLLVGCGFKKEVKDEDSERLATYLEKLENFKPHEKSLNNTVDNKEFEEFLNDVFVYFNELDFLTMHYTVVDYKAYGIKKPEVKIGRAEYSFDQELYESILNQLETMKKFDYDSLSYRQQYDYDILEYSLYETIVDASCWKYHQFFDSKNNVFENLESNFINYTFYDQESVDDYMILLKDYKRYLDACLEYTRLQAKEGIYLVDGCINEVVDYGRSFANAQDNTMIYTFAERLDECDFLSDEKKQEYILENKKIVEEEIIPATLAAADEIDSYYGKGSYEKAKLINISEDYAKAVYYLKFSNNKPIKETFDELVTNFKALEENFLEVLNDEDLLNRTANYLYANEYPFNLDAVDTLEYLRKHAYICYPDLGDAAYKVDYLSDETGTSTTKAYYYNAPVDNYNQNIIKVNPNLTEVGMDTYSTLSHEGFPGHLYQSVYSLKNNMHIFRRTMGFIGNSEGYAVTAQLDALKMAGIDDDRIAQAIFFNDNEYFLMYSIVDIAINCLGWSTKEVLRFFDGDEIYTLDESNVKGLAEFFIERPGLYCSYGVGFSNFMTLRNKAKESLGDEFDLVEYNSYVLKNGCMPFNILEDCIDEYINK